METTYRRGERELYLDLLRVLATFAVVFLHVSAKGVSLPVETFNWHVAVVYDSSVRWAVPMFVMISGALFLRPKKEITIRRILTRNVKRLLVAYLFWYLAYVCFDIIVNSIKIGVFSFDVSYLEPEFHLWFLPMLAVVYLFIPILRRVVVDDRLLRYCLILWGTYIAIGFLLERDVPQISPLFSIHIVPGYLGYFVLGYFLSKSSLTGQQCRIIYGLGWAGLLVAATGCIVRSWNQGGADVKFMSELSPQVAMMATALFLWVKQLAPRVEDRVAACVEFCRKDMFGVYLVHVLWLWVFDRLPLRDIGSYAIVIPIWALSVFICSLFTSKMLRRIPLLQSVSV